MAFGEAVQPSTEPFGCNPDNALDRGVLLIRFVVHGPTVGDHTGARSSGSEVDKPASFTTSKLSAGRTSPALAGSGVGCGLAGPHAARNYTRRMAASWPSPHMSQSHSFFGPPPSRVHQRYVA